ncbi:hypothetical protein [Sandarakinorhabdus sp. AAP62]|uniref:hypothetical protein n=1 Tax=Sandarakinorhabdus sp. AAP62 TaxID=1248916 RepID=UPI0003130614|nr:hypothetical protein [Sandarakinorhabdus sp. AAP62]
MIRLSLLLIAAAPALAQPPQSTPAPSRWGKANAANLAAMARPQDLAQPAPASPASGRMEAAAVTRLLNDKGKDLLRENTRQGGGAPQ